VNNEAEDSIVVHSSKADLNIDNTNTDYLKAIQVFGASNLL